MNKKTSTRNISVLFQEFFPTFYENFCQGEIDCKSIHALYLDLCTQLDYEPWLDLENGLNFSSFIHLCHDHFTEKVDTEYLTQVLSDEETYEQLVVGPFVLSVDID